MSETTYFRRKRDGLCVRCGEKAVRGKVMCAECAAKQKIIAKNNREFYRSMGFCYRCGKNKLFGDEKECPECLAKMYEANKKSIQRRNIDLSDYYKKYYQKLKESGKCLDCKKNVENGHVYCDACLIKRRNLGKKYRRKNDNCSIDRSERPSYGLCYTCGEPLDRDGRICQKCADKMIMNLQTKRGKTITSK